MKQKMMRRKEKQIGRGLGGAIILFSLLLLAVFLFSGCEIEEGTGLTIPVMLADAEGIEVLSDNPVRIPIGGDARFELRMDEALMIDNLPSDATLEDGVLTLKSVFFPKTLKLDTHMRVSCDFFASANVLSAGTLDVSLPNGTYWSETEVTLSAVPEEGFHFLGYSVGALAEDGGEIVSVDPNYTFELSESIRIFANFALTWTDPALTVTVPKDKWVLIYHANGGVLAETGADGTKTIEFSNTYYHCPNTLVDRDYFEREGYVLYGYNTAADGSGTYYAPGWNVIMPERGAISLFCMWAKVSDPADFEYRVQNGAIYLTKYKGDDEFVVIPETIDGLNVDTIMSRTFENLDNMKKLFITKNVRALYDKSVLSCDSFEELYFSDSVVSLTDAAFSDCPNFHKLYMMAAVAPHYLNSRNGTYCIKYERLITAPGKKLIIASGSNSAYGVNSPLLEELLQEGGHEYSVVNYGQNAGTALTFYPEVIAYHMNEGDLLVLAPEINKFQFGYSEINTTLWQIFESAYDAFACVDIRHYDKLFTSFSTFNNARKRGVCADNAYEKYTTDTVNSYGDYSKNKVGYEKSYASTVQALLDKGGAGSWDYNSSVSYINSYGAKLNRTLDMVAAKGGTVLISFAAANIINFKAASQEQGGTPQKNLEAAVDEKLHGIRISEVATYTMNTELFYNSHNHPTSAGAISRTEWLSADILAYLNNKG